MGKTLNKFIACILLAALIMPAMPTTAAAQWSSQKDFDADDRRDMRNQTMFYGGLLLGMLVLVGIKAMIVQARESNAQKQPNDDLAGWNQGQKYAPPAGFSGSYKVNRSAAGAVQKQRPNGPAGRDQEDAPPGLGRGYIPQE
jgi:hypothetical protein